LRQQPEKSADPASYICSMRPTVALIAAVLFSTFCRGQKVDMVYRNQVKLNTSSIPLGILSIAYERPLQKKLSISLGLRWLPQRGLSRGASKLIGIKDSNTTAFFLGTRFGGFAITPELRRYFGKKNNQGFYLGLLSRYERHWVSAPFRTSFASSNTTFEALLKGRVQGYGVGAQCGIQLSLGPRFSLDWMLAGIVLTRATARLSAQTSNFGLNLSEQEQVNLNIIATAASLFTNFSPSISNQEIGFSASKTIPGFRTGLCLGYRF
jgi:hypothetical protein